MQTALNVTQAYLERVGMEISVEKTTFVLVHRDKRIRSKAALIFDLFIDGQTIVRQSMIRFLGLVIDEKSNAREWTLNIKHQWK